MGKIPTIHDLKIFTECLENVRHLVEKLGDVSKSILKIVEDLNEEEVSRICEVKELLQDVRKLFVKYLSFVREIDCIYEFLDSHQETVKDIEQDLRRQTPIYEDLLSLLRILSSSVEAAEISYKELNDECGICLLYTSPSPRDRQKSRMPSSA